MLLLPQENGWHDGDYRGYYVCLRQSILSAGYTIMHHFFKKMPSPVGLLTLIASGNGLAAVLWQNENLRRVRQMSPQEDPYHAVLLDTERQLNEYFAGERTAFTLPLDFVGTAFQQKVWQALVKIPYGETRSYAQVAQEIGHPRAVRAVGAANGKNPISIIAPCHRVIGSSGKLTGFAGGLESKALLLNLEAQQQSGKRFILI